MCKKINSSRFFPSFLYKLLVFSFAFFFYFPVIDSAAQLKLEWDENSEEDLSGYRVFCRQEGQIYDYYHPVWDGTENTCTFSGDIEDTRCFFVVRAYNTSNIESGNSNEVIYQPEDPQETCTDADFDGYYAESGCGTTVDCDDNDSSINPGETEICDDNKDNNCNGAVDCSDPDCECENTFDVTIHKPADYLIVPNLQAGDEYYLDRDYYLTSIPPELDTGTEEWIMTKNRDKKNTSTSFLEFTISQPSTVYIAYDSRASSPPNWLKDNFEPTSLDIEVEEGIYGGLTLDVFKRVFSAGTVTLGGNLASGAYGAKSNYIVIVQTRTAVPEICDNGLDDDSDGLIDCSDPDCECEDTFDVTIHKPADYLVVPNLQAGDKYYLDRDYYLTSIPPELDTGTEEWIMTKNGDKNNTSTSFLEFTISQPSLVYIAYDSRADSVPDWLGYKFFPASLEIEVEDGSLTLNVFMRPFFRAGSIALGGNLASGAYGANSNYIVIVKPL